MRPSSFYLFSNCRGFVNKAGAAFTECDDKIDISEDAGDAKSFLERMRELASKMHFVSVLVHCYIEQWTFNKAELE